MASRSRRFSTSRSVTSKEVPMMPASRPASSKKGRSVTLASNSLPSRRRTANTPAQVSPRVSDSKISAASGADPTEGVISVISCPRTSSDDHP